MVIEIEDDTRIDMSLMTCAEIVVQDPTTVVCLLAGMTIMDVTEDVVEDMAME